MKISDLLTLVSIVVTIIISVIGGVYAIITNTKRFELSEQYKNNLLSWYSKVMFIISKLEGEYSENERNDTLRELSALIEIGRFFFPNINKNDGFRKEKPKAYQGHTHAALGFLLDIYQMGDDENINENREKIDCMKRDFTSIVFEVISPNERIKSIKHYAKITIPEETSDTDLTSMEHVQLIISEFYNQKRNKEKR